MNGCINANVKRRLPQKQLIKKMKSYFREDFQQVKISSFVLKFNSHVDLTAANVK